MRLRMPAGASPAGLGDSRRLLDLVPAVPVPVWGRDELEAGEMWNSNSVIAWLVASAGVPTELISLPPHGRAPGWLAGLAVARRDAAANPFCEPACGRRLPTSA